METTITLTDADIDAAPAGTVFAFTSDTVEHLCTIEGSDIVDGENEYIVRFLSPWSTVYGTLISDFYEGVKAARLSVPSGGAIFDALERAEKDVESDEMRLERAREELAVSKALVAKLSALWNEE